MKVDRTTSELKKWLIWAGVCALLAAGALGIALPQEAAAGRDWTAAAFVGGLLVVAVPVLAVIGFRTVHKRALVLDESGVRWEEDGKAKWSIAWREVAGVRLRPTDRGDRVRYRFTLQLDPVAFQQRSAASKGG